MELSKLQDALYEELANVFKAGNKFADFGAWLVVLDEQGDEVDTVKLYVRGSGCGRDILEVCDCRACECLEEEQFGVEGTLGARSEEELRRIASAIAGVLRRKDGGFEEYVEQLRRMGFEVVAPKPDEGGGPGWDW